MNINHRIYPDVDGSKLLTVAAKILSSQLLFLSSCLRLSFYFLLVLPACTAHARQPDPVYNHNFTFIKNDLAGSYQLREDIFLNRNQNNHKTWSPPKEPFTGRLDFNGYRILRWVYRVEDREAALFTDTRNAWFGNAVLEDFDVTGHPAAALILGSNTVIDGLQITKGVFKGFDQYGSAIQAGSGVGIIIRGDNVTINDASLSGTVIHGGSSNMGFGGNSTGVLIEGNHARINGASINKNGNGGYGGRSGFRSARGGDSIGIQIAGRDAVISDTLISNTGSAGPLVGHSVGIVIADSGDAMFTHTLLLSSAHGAGGGRCDCLGLQGGRSAGILSNGHSKFDNLLLFSNGDGGNGDSAPAESCPAYDEGSGHEGSGDNGLLMPDARTNTEDCRRYERCLTSDLARGGDSSAVIINDGRTEFNGAVLISSGSGGKGGKLTASGLNCTLSGFPEGSSAGVIINSGDVVFNRTSVFSGDSNTKVLQNASSASVNVSRIPDSEIRQTWIDWAFRYCTLKPNSPVLRGARSLLSQEALPTPDCAQYDCANTSPKLPSGSLKYLLSDGHRWHGFLSEIHGDGVTWYHSLYNEQDETIYQPRCNTWSSLIYLNDERLFVDAVALAHGDIYLAYHHFGAEGSQLARYTLVNGEPLIRESALELPARALDLFYRDNQLYLVVEHEVYRNVNNEPLPLLAIGHPLEDEETIKAADYSFGLLYLLTADSEKRWQLKSTDDQFSPVPVLASTGPAVLQVLAEYVHLLLQDDQHIRWLRYTLRGEKVGESLFLLPELTTLNNMMLVPLPQSGEEEQEFQLLAIGSRGGQPWRELIMEPFIASTHSGSIFSAYWQPWLKGVVIAGSVSLPTSLIAIGCLIKSVCRRFRTEQKEILELWPPSSRSRLPDQGISDTRELMTSPADYIHPSTSSSGNTILPILPNTGLGDPHRIYETIPSIADLTAHYDFGDSYYEMEDLEGEEDEGEGEGEREEDDQDEREEDDQDEREEDDQDEREEEEPAYSVLQH